MSNSEANLTLEQFLSKRESESKKPWTDELAEAAEREYYLVQRQKSLDEENATRTGKGTRAFCGYTRGKNPQLVQWEAFDTEHPETCPKTPAEFCDLTQIGDDPTLTDLFIRGYNEKQRELASDPIAEYFESNWSDEIRKSFRNSVRTATTATGLAIEDIVKMLKPHVVKNLAEKASA